MAPVLMSSMWPVTTMNPACSMAVRSIRTMSGLVFTTATTVASMRTSARVRVRPPVDMEAPCQGSRSSPAVPDPAGLGTSAPQVVGKRDAAEHAVGRVASDVQLGGALSAAGAGPDPAAPLLLQQNLDAEIRAEA